MVSGQIADAEGSAPYFVMRVKAGGAEKWEVYRRSGGRAVKSFDSKSDADRWAAKKNVKGS